MSYILVDVEADGPIPGDSGMVCLGAIVVDPALDRTFYGQRKPISERWVLGATLTMKAEHGRKIPLK